MAEVILDATGVVLAGGRSSRFGSDKALAPWHGKTLVENAVGVLSGIFSENLVVTKTAERFRFLAGDGLAVVEDSFEGRHPLNGIMTALQRAGTRHVFVCACDMPFLRPSLILGLWSARADYDAVVPVWRGSRQPLCAVYSKNCLEPMARLSRSPERGIRDLFDVVRTRFYLEAEAAADDPAGLSFSDLDSRREYEEALRLAGG